MTLLFLRKIGASLSISFLSLILVIFVGIYVTHQQNHLKELEQRLLFLDRQAVQSQEAEIFMKAHVEEFAAFQACQFDQSVSPAVLQNSLSYPIDFGQMTGITVDGHSKDLISQNLSFSMACLQDREVFIFLDHLLKSGPGFFQIHEMIINRICPLSDEMLEKIVTGKPQILFDGKIIATWIHR